MNKIALIVLYFGKLPYNFQLWLEGCKYNPTINWIVFTDDRTEYDYPGNVAVSYCTFKEIKERIQTKFEFVISLERPYKLCDYKVSYGEIFQEELEGYDFWGYCDVDVLFGNIRKFVTDEVLNKYEKIGFQGHLTLYRNTETVRTRYRSRIAGLDDYSTIFGSEQNYMFDEEVMDKIYESLGIPVWKELHFAHLLKYSPDFYLGHRPEAEKHYNQHQIFTWNDGILKRWYLLNGVVEQEECSYIHFFCRVMDLKLRTQKNVKALLIRPNVIEDMDCERITAKFIKKKAHCNKILFRIRYLLRNRKKVSARKLVDAVKRSDAQRRMMKY